MLRDRFRAFTVLLMIGSIITITVVLGELFTHFLYGTFIEPETDVVRAYLADHPVETALSIFMVLVVIVSATAFFEAIRETFLPWIERSQDRRGSEPRDNEPSSKPEARDEPPVPSPSLMTAYELVGRDELWSKLKQLLLSSYSRARVFVLELLPGIGKSDLAIRLACDEDIKRYFDGGVLWADLGLKPDVDEILRKWATELGLDSEKIKHTDAQSVKEAIRGTIGERRERRFLLLIDDAWLDEHKGTEKIERFVFSTNANCTHLITTRQPAISAQLTTDQAFIMTVPELSECEGIELLTQVAPTAVRKVDRRTLEELVELAGGIPLALILIGRHLLRVIHVSGPSRLNEALHELRQAKRRLSLPLGPADKELRRGQRVPVSLQAVIEISYKSLDDEAQRAFRNLSIFQPKRLNGFTTEAALEISDISQDTLQRLIECGLLEILIKEPENSEPERYALQRTIADYARSLLPDKEAKRLHRKGVAYYQDWLTKYDNREDVTAYQLWYRYEDPEWLDMKAGWLYHLTYVEARATAYLNFTQLYFDAFWWWGHYVDYPVCQRLLDDWERTQILSEGDEKYLCLLRDFHNSYLTEYERLIKDWEETQILAKDDEEETPRLRAFPTTLLVRARRYWHVALLRIRRWLGLNGQISFLHLLRAFHDSHPIEYRKKGEGDWNKVEEALLGVRRLVGLEEQNSGPDSESAYTLRHLRAITNIFLAHACRYRRVEDDRADRYYDEALDFFEQANADEDWNIPWILYELGDLYMERGRSDDVMHDKALEKCQESLGKTLEEGVGFEIKARVYRVRADVFWQRNDLLEEDLLDRAFDNYLYAAFYAYAYHGSQGNGKPDHYTVAFYREMVERTLVRLRTLWNKGQRKKTLQLCDRLHSFWDPYWNRVGTRRIGSATIESLWAGNDLESIAAYLFPAEPIEDVLKNPNDYVEQVDSVYIEIVGQSKAE